MLQNRSIHLNQFGAQPFREMYEKDLQPKNSTQSCLVYIYRRDFLLYDCFLYHRVLPNLSILSIEPKEPSKSTYVI